MEFKKIRFFVHIIMLISFLFSTSQSFADTTLKDVKQETRDLVKVLKSYTSSQRDEALEKTEAALSDLDDHIDSLETRIDNN